jgi:hypothetical protein
MWERATRAEPFLSGMFTRGEVVYERATRAEPFLSGMFTRGEVVYADTGGEAASHREPVAIFAREVLPQYSGDLDDGTVGASR